MQVKLKKQYLTFDEFEMERMYVGSEKYLFFMTKMYVDNIIKEENLRYACISMNGGSKIMHKTKEELWQTVGKFSLRKANFEINEI